MNIFIGKGNLVADPERRVTQSGKDMVSFRVAVERAYKDKDGKRLVDFFSCVAFNFTALSIEKYFKKGSPIVFRGPIYQDTYVDKNNIKRTQYTVYVEGFDFCGGKTESSKANIDIEVPPPDDEDFPWEV